MHLLEDNAYTHYRAIHTKHYCSLSSCRISLHRKAAESVGNFVGPPHCARATSKKAAVKQIPKRDALASCKSRRTLQVRVFSSLISSTGKLHQFVVCPNGQSCTRQARLYPYTNVELFKSFPRSKQPRS